MHSDIWLKGYKRFVVPADIFVTLNLHTPAIQKYVTNLYAPTLYRVKGKSRPYHQDIYLSMNRKDSVQFIEKCYSLYEQKMYRVAFSILNDPHAAEDAVQEAFLRLMKSNRTFDDAESDDCKRYIISVIKSTAISIYRIRKRESKVLSLSDLEGTLESNNNELDSKDASDLKSILDELPAKYKDVVQCLVIDSLSVRETSSRLHISESCVRKRFERAKKKLKGHVQLSDV